MYIISLFKLLVTAPPLNVFNFDVVKLDLNDMILSRDQTE